MTPLPDAPERAKMTAQISICEGHSRRGVSGINHLNPEGGEKANGGE